MNQSAPTPETAPESPEPVDDRWLSLIDTALKVQAPLARSYVRRLRSKHPDATREELLSALHRRFTALSTLTGAGIGGTAALPGIGTAVAVGLTVGEGISFAESCAFLTLATAEIHEVDMDDRETRRLILMAVLSGERGAEIVARAMGKQGLQWNALLGGGGGIVPSFVSKQVSRYVRKRVISRSGKLWMVRLLPFGIGAAIGGFGARAISRTVIEVLEDIFAQAETIEGELAGQGAALEG